MAAIRIAMRAMPISTAWMLGVAVLLAGAAPARSQTAQAPEDAVATAVKNDTDPTRPVLFSIRPEFYNPSPTVSQASLIFRYDQATLRARRWLPGKRGVILRFEVPLAETHVDGTARRAGLGDAYGQILVAPYFTRRRAFVVGTGLLIPTASDPLLGAAKWVLAPAVAPVWFFGRGMFLVKFQNFVSIAGSPSRPDVNFLLITPSFIHAVGRRWWVLADSETRTLWRVDAHTGVKSGVQVGRNLGGVSVWVKPELWWGPNNDGRWNLKFGLVWYR
jgi:hypothetical protein